MRTTTAVLINVGLALWITGCGGWRMGGGLVRPSNDSLQLGKTTYGEIVARFGRPPMERTMLKNQHTLKVIVYGDIAPLIHKNLVRRMSFSFADLVLVGHEFTSSFDHDATNFDETKIAQIKQGETTEAQVIALLGEPTGRVIFPFVGRDEKGLTYLYAQFPRGWSSVEKHEKSFLVLINEHGVVTRTQFRDTGEK